IELGSYERRFLDDGLEHPALVAGEGAARHDADRVAGLRLVVLVMRLVADALADVLAVAGVLEATLDLDNDGLLHLDRDHRPQDDPALTLLCRGLLLGLSHGVMPAFRPRQPCARGQSSGCGRCPGGSR